MPELFNNSVSNGRNSKIDSKIFVKVHKSYRTVVAVCDSELIGKKFEEGIKQLDIRESFYKGEEKSFEEVIEILEFQKKEDAIFNIVGENSIKASKKAEIIDDKGIFKIKKIPFSLVLL